MRRGRDVRCGTVRVPLDHARPGHGSLRLAVAVVKTTAERARRDPIVFLARGPGEKLLAALTS